MVRAKGNSGSPGSTTRAMITKKDAFVVISMRVRYCKRCSGYSRVQRGGTRISRRVFVRDN